MTQLSTLLHLRASHFIGQTYYKNGNYIWGSQFETSFFSIREWELRLFSVGFPVLARSAGTGSVCALHASEQWCAHVSIARLVALINLITAQHAQREREDSVERVITLREGFSMWLSLPFLFEVLLCIPSLTPLSQSFMLQHVSHRTSFNKHTHTYIPTCLCTVYPLFCYRDVWYITLIRITCEFQVTMRACGISKILINTKQYRLYFKQKYWYRYTQMGLSYWSQLRRIPRTMRSIDVSLWHNIYIFCVHNAIATHLHRLLWGHPVSTTF